MKNPFPIPNLLTPLILTVMSLCTSACQTVSPAPLEPVDPATILFEDPMTGDWRDNWFLDGQKAVLTQDENGLHFQATSEPDMWQKRHESPEMRELFDSYHAVLWTHREFEGEIGLRVEISRTSGGFTFLLYLLARGVGRDPYTEDITAWNDLRDISKMNLYFGGMNLTCVTFRDQIRLRRYPWMEGEGEKFTDNLIGEMLDYDQLPVGNTYIVDIELRTETIRIRVEEVGNPKNLLDRTFNRIDDLDPRRPAPSTRGRIGLRHMIGTGVLYRNFQVRRL